MSGPLDSKFGRDRIRMRKLITAALARAVERHRRALRRADGFDHSSVTECVVLMPWEQRRQLLAWQDEWEFYLRQERNKLYDGNKYERREHVKQLARTRREALAVRADRAAGA